MPAGAGERDMPLSRVIDEKFMVGTVRGLLFGCFFQEGASWMERTVAMEQFWRRRYCGRWISWQLRGVKLLSDRSYGFPA